MKLEIKHLSAYLPYELECNVIGSDKYTYNNCLLTGASTKDSHESFCFLYKDDMIAEVSMVHIEDIKPILRPLSDIAKEIEHNGEKFEPIEYLYNNYTPITKSVKGMYMDLQSPLDYRFDVVQKLIEWHFDVFGFIKAGLAVKKD